MYIEIQCSTFLCFLTPFSDLFLGNKVCNKLSVIFSILIPRQHGIPCGPGATHCATLMSYSNYRKEQPVDSLLTRNATSEGGSVETPSEMTLEKGLASLLHPHTAPLALFPGQRRGERGYSASCNLLKSFSLHRFSHKRLYRR